MIFIIGLIIFIFLAVFIVSLGIGVLAIALMGFATWVIFMIGSWIGAAVAMSIGGDTQIGFLFGGLSSVAMLWWGIVRFGQVGKKAEQQCAK